MGSRTATVKVQRPNIFISYRRDDSAGFARHLFDSLAARFGEQRVFFDQSTIEPGAAFPKRIEAAIRTSGVMLVIIGQRWFERESEAKEPRIRSARDWVRREITLALRQGTRVIPVLVDGAAIPDKNDLPASLAALPTLNAITIPWHESVNALSKIIAEATDSSSRYDLMRHLGNLTEARRKRPLILTAMEMSLAHQGDQVNLDDGDLMKKFKSVTKRELAQTGTTMKEIIYVIDRVGIAGRTTRGARRLYTARASRLKSGDQVASELEKGRPIVSGMIVYKKWWSRDVMKTGLIEDWKDAGPLQGAILAAIVGFNPADGALRFLTQFPDWGDHGLGTITAAAAKRFMDPPDSMYSIEASEAVTL